MTHNTSGSPGQLDRPTLFGRFGRGKIAVFVMAALLLGSLAFAPVRAVASQVLGIFRVQRMQTISISQADLESVGQMFEEGNGEVSLESLGDVSVEGASTEPSETTIEEAQAMVDFDLKTPAGIEGTPTAMVQQPMTAKFKLHVDKVNELLESYGATELFSTSMEGKEFSIHMPATVVIAYPDAQQSTERGSEDVDADRAAEDAATFRDPALGLIVAQSRGPQLNVPPGVNPLEIRNVTLGLPFLPENVRSQLAGVQDWQNTLLIPNVEGMSREISVAGMPGVIMVPDADAFGDGSTTPVPSDVPVVVMWNDNGVMRAVGGTGGEARILGIAESMAR